MQSTFNLRQFIIVAVLVSLWVNVSEVFRYFIIVLPEMRAFLSMIPNLAPLNFQVVLIWGAWDTLLTAFIVFMFWLVAQAFGNNLRSVFVAGIASWAAFFVLFWVGMCNMSLAQPKLALIALPLALLETVIASYIASRLYARYA
jgi:hypothetical protein